ncbi:hypothetical protein NMY22_g6444 [Coprinellus aureogranulatus]|nr:hypothetical protein NMY22_g6444 [Coprinellus aureogranulatus]
MRILKAQVEPKIRPPFTQLSDKVDWAGHREAQVNMRFDAAMVQRKGRFGKLSAEGYSLQMRKNVIKGLKAPSQGYTHTIMRTRDYLPETVAKIEARNLEACHISDCIAPLSEFREFFGAWKADMHIAPEQRIVEGEHTPLVAHAAEDDHWMIARYDWTRDVASRTWYAF